MSHAPPTPSSVRPLAVGPRARHAGRVRRALAPFACALACAALGASDAGAGAAPSDDPALALPAGVERDPTVPRPEDVLGWPVGTWHVRHDQLVRYCEVVAEASPRVSLTVTGRTWEDRPLLLLAITSPENQARLEAIRSEHLRAVETGERVDGKLVVWIGASIHGNEPSGSNAVPLLLWHLASARDAETTRLLDDVVVLLDPSQNPDGLSRFAGWVNAHKGAHLVADAAHREHVEPWPSGRGNHYWTDLNRDWLLLTHPESRARVEQFQRWRPNVVTDHHEMGTGSTFFFQPGVDGRTNPLTPPRNQELTAAIAAFHAEALDARGRLYYSGETFDDFYYGKGSTYPDVQGAVGILFEQASSRGHLQENAWGELPFGMTIGNQVTTALSTLRAAHALSDALLDFQADATRAALLAEDDPRGGWVLGDDGDPARAARLLGLLLAHRVEVRELAARVERDGTSYEPGHAWVVPLRQPQGTLARAVLERVTEFADDVFYDVSTWTLPLAFGLPWSEVERGAFDALAGARLDAPPAPDVRDVDAPARAWLLDWRSSAAPRAVARLLAAGVRAGVATRPIEVDTRDGRLALPAGTVTIPAGVQDVAPDALAALLAEAAADGVALHATPSGLTAAGPDLGSPSVRALRMPKVVLLVGDGVSSGEAGEAWLQLDRRWDVPVLLLDLERLASYDLHDTTHVLALGCDEPPTAALDRLDAWVRAGGVLVGGTRAVRWVGSKILAEPPSRAGGGDEPAPPEGADEPPEATRPAYADAERENAKDLVAGAFFEAVLDLTHPLAFGFARDRLPLFKSATTTLAPASDAYTNVALYAEAPRLSGYASEANVRKIAGTAAVVAQRKGAGAVVRLVDDPLFRGVTDGSARLLANALFFGHVLDTTAGRGDEDDDAAGH